MGRNRGNPEFASRRDELYATASKEFGPAIDRLTVGYEADAEKRRDLKQDIHFQLWRSFELFDGRCSLRTWTYRVAHNTAASYVNRERRNSPTFVGLEELEQSPPAEDREFEIDQRRLLDRLSRLIQKLKPLDRQIMISYLEEMDAAAIAEITGLSPANVSMKVHRIKEILSRHFFQETHHV